MAYFSKAFFALLCLLLLAIVTEARNINTKNVDFVRTRGAHFVLNGSPFLFNGFNSYWLMHVAAEPTERYKVSEVFKEASAAGLSVCRTWAFSDGGDAALQISPGVYDERVLQVVFIIAYLFDQAHVKVENYLTEQTFCLLIMSRELAAYNFISMAFN